MITPHHNRKQKVCKDIIAYPEEKTNKKHQIPPHKRKGSSRKKPYSPYIHVVTLCCPPPLRSRLPRKGAGFSALGGRIGLRVAASFLAGFPGRFPPPSAAPLNLLCGLLSCAVPSPLRVPAFSFSGFFFYTVLFSCAPLLSSAAVWSYAPLFLSF